MNRDQIETVLGGIPLPIILIGADHRVAASNALARLLFGTVNSLTEWYRPDGGLSADDLADALVTTTFRGLRTARS